jgi:hypothetical protein
MGTDMLRCYLLFTYVYVYVHTCACTHAHTSFSRLDKFIILEVWLPCWGLLSAFQILFCDIWLYIRCHLYAVRLSSLRKLSSSLIFSVQTAPQYRCMTLEADISVLIYWALFQLTSVWIPSWPLNYAGWYYFLWTHVFWYIYIYIYIYISTSVIWNTTFFAHYDLQGLEWN